MYQCGPLLDRFPFYILLVTFTKISREIPNLVKIGQKCRAIDMKTEVSFIVAGGIQCHNSALFERNGISLLGCTLRECATLGYTYIF